MMGREVFAAALLAAFGTAAIAESGPEACAALEDEHKRKLCYDLAYKIRPLEPAKGEDQGKWEVSSTFSRIDDSETVFLLLDSNNSVDCGRYKQEPVSLILRCEENTTVMYYSANCHMASGYRGYGDVTYRLGSGKAQTVSMDVSSDKRAIGLWRGRQSIPVIKQMFENERMTVRMTPFGNSSITASFDIAGLESAIKPLRKACSW
ncbi:type VI secretion system-associated protein TagO [Roseibium sp. RKSG952]|uniref:type VI secretion system-associated protein TagO n=1 Tax=Roseibium sp. RKSG952 TaxID=2529384 RepID=UPI0018AD1D18|nr:type VI secretion system-associated protein TagO [Roseibium sp. RKSG952]